MKVVGKEVSGGGPISGKWFYITCCMLSLFKLWLVSGEEIVARYTPHDHLWHMQAASRGYWFGDDYSHMSFVQQPVYGLWIDLVYQTGLPLRLGIELLYIASALLFIVALSRAGIARIVALLCFAAITFHPTSFQLFNETLAETFYAPVFLLALAGMIMMWVHRDDRASFTYALLSGFFFSLLWNTRKENILIAALFLLLLFLILLIGWRERASLSVVKRRLAVLVGIPLMVVLGVSLTVKTANYLTFGQFVSTEMDAAGYKAAYRALQRIKPSPSVRFIPVTEKSRRLAYSVSPAFKELEPILEDPSNNYTSRTKAIMGIPNEIGAGWFYWHLRDAAAKAGHHRSAREADAYYQRVADEINAAIDSGRLPGRRVLMTFLEPDTSNYIQYLPQSFTKVWQAFTSKLSHPRQLDDPALNPTYVRLFDEMANRRASLTRVPGITVQGWTYQEKGRIRKVMARAKAGEIVAATEEFSARPDVLNALAAKGKTVPEKTGFALLVPAKLKADIGDLQLVFVTEQGYEISAPDNGFIVNKPTRTGTSGSEIVYNIDSIQRPLTHQPAESLQDAIAGFYESTLVYLGYLSILAMVVLLSAGRSSWSKDNTYAILVLLLFVVVTRLGLFALLDASSWPAARLRYIFPVMPFYSCFLVLCIYQACAVIKTRLTKKAPSLVSAQESTT